MKHMLRRLTLASLAAVLLTISALADSGPKDLLTVKVENAPEEGYYLDLVAEGKGYLCFVEVKLRKDHHLAQAREFVTPAKQRKVRIAAQYYLLDHPTQLQPRFDVIEVYAPQGRDTAQPEICHWENAF